MFHEWNNSTDAFVGDLYPQFWENTYENGLLMQQIYSDGSDQVTYYNYTYDSEGREILVESRYGSAESIYNSDGLLEQTNQSNANSITYTNYSYDDDSQLIQVTITYTMESGTIHHTRR